MRMPTMVKGEPFGWIGVPDQVPSVMSGQTWDDSSRRRLSGLNRVYPAWFPLLASSSRPRFWMKAPVAPASVATTLIA